MLTQVCEVSHRDSFTAGAMRSSVIWWQRQWT